MKVFLIANRARILKVLTIFLVFILIFGAVYSALSFKYGDGIMGVKYMYKQKNNSIDVLILGSSHAFENINTGVLYDSYGIAAYTLAGSVQPYWSTYYYLTEALKTQRPKLIVLDALGSTFNSEYSDHSRIIKNTLGIRDFSSRYRLLKISSPANDFNDYLFSYRLWHSRYTELGASDFSEYYRRPFWEYYKGFGINFARKAQKKPEPDKIKSTAALNPKTEEYYRKIIELCNNENIPLLIIKSPCQVSENEMKQYNMSAKIADEYGVTFLNFNTSAYYNAMKLDFDNDYADGGHLNYIGNVKYTKALADEIKKRYDIPDRRNQAEYESWSLHSKDVLGRTENQYLKNEGEISAYFDKLKRERYTITFATVTDTDKFLKKCRTSVENLGIDASKLHDNCVTVICNSEIEYLDASDFNKRIHLDNHVLDINKNTNNISIIWDGQEQISERKGCYLCVYDTFSEELVENIRFEWNEGKTVKKPAVEKK